MSYQDNQAPLGIEFGDRATLRNSMDENVTRKDQTAVSIPENCKAEQAKDCSAVDISLSLNSKPLQNVISKKQTSSTIEPRGFVYEGTFNHETH